MRFTILATLLVAFISLTSFTANTSNVEVVKNGNLVAIAKSALKSNCPNTQGNLQVSVKTVSSCFAGGFITEVTFYRKPNCPPGQICIQTIELVGTVQLGCDNNVISVTCGGAATI